MVYFSVNIIFLWNRFPKYIYIITWLKFLPCQKSKIQKSNFVENRANLSGFDRGGLAIFLRNLGDMMQKFQPCSAQHMDYVASYL